jgi:uncharacterized membrane protein
VPLARWSALLGLVGLAISAYLTVVHYTAGQVPLACSTSGLVNCEQVTSSPESMLGPVPVAVLGVAWFGVFLLAVAEWAADQPASVRQGVGRQPGRS